MARNEFGILMKGSGTTVGDCGTDLPTHTTKYHLNRYPVPVPVQQQVY